MNNIFFFFSAPLPPMNGEALTLSTSLYKRGKNTRNVARTVRARFLDWAELSFILSWVLFFLSTFMLSFVFAFFFCSHLLSTL